MAAAPVSRPARRLGWIGLGALGLASATRARASGWEVWGCDASPARAEAAADAGLQVVDGPQQAADQTYELVVCCVRDADQVEQVLTGPDGALAAKPDLVGVVMSSISVEAMARVAARGHAEGATLVAAPVLGNPTTAAAGESLFLLAGEAGARERTRGLLDDLGRDTVELGDDPGSAQAMKLVSQLIQIVGMLATFEGVELARGHGLSPEDVRRVLSATEPSWTTDNWDYATELWRRRDPATSLGLFAKDLDGAARDARAAGLDLSLLEAARQRLLERLDAIDSMKYQ
jgi:3-hydroxyisobutyrate dehydrogenase